MKTVTYDGVAAVTTDGVADALLELAMTVARFSNYELVTIPVAAAGGAEQLTLMLGPTIHLSAQSIAGSETAALDGDAEAVSRLRERSQVIIGPFHDIHAGAGGRFGW